MEIKMPEFFGPKSARIVSISVKEGDMIPAWGELMQIETEKGAEPIKSKKPGKVEKILVKVGDDLPSGTVLAMVSEADAQPAKAAAEPAAAEKKAEPADAELLEIKMPEFFGPKSGKITAISVKPGDEVAAWGELMQIETEKGAEPVKSKKAGVVRSVNAHVGDDLPSGTILATIAVGAKAAAAPAPEKKAETGTGKTELEIRMPEFFGPKSAKIISISVKPGDAVAAWGELMQIENEKGSEPVKSKKAGIVESIGVKVGDDVPSGTVLATIALGEAAPAPVQAEAPAAAASAAARTDVLIIGGGIGGYTAAIIAARGGRQVTLVEKDTLGGTCLNVGCIPTKALIASSSLCRKIGNAAEFGIQVEGSVKPDMPAIISRKDRIVSRLVGGVGYLMNKNKITVVKGTASFTDDRHVKVNDTVYEFGDCIIATGSLVAMPPVAGIDGRNVMDSTAALSSPVLPGSITIVGGGVIGMEFAFLYRNLGAEVTVIEFLPKLLATQDADISDMIADIAVKRGITLELGAKVVSLTDTVSGQVLTAFEKDGSTHYAVADKALVATGRRSNMDGLGLEHTGVTLNDRGRGIKVDDHMRTSVAHIYAVGDVNNLIQLAHAAGDQGTIAAHNILGGDESFDINVIPSVIFTDPEIASVGINVDAAKKRGINVKTGIFHYSASGKALTMGETEGFVRLVKDENDVIIGGTIIGADASTLIATIAVCVANKMKDADLDRTVFAHPTTAEAVHEAALDLSIGAINE